MSRAPDAVPFRQRLRGVPNTIGMVLAGALFVAGVLVATVPYEVTVGDETVACGSALFELVVPSDDGKVPTAAACEDEVGTRLLLAAVGIGIGVAGGLATRQIRRRRYDPQRFDLVDARAR